MVTKVSTALGAPLAAFLPVTPDSKNLDYLLADARVQCDLAARALFDKPVGTESGAASNGETDFGTFRCAFTNGVWPQMKGPHPWLAIIDSNNCHHLSTLLAEQAFLNTAPNRAKIVFNFDGHSDYPRVAGVASIACHNWGLYTVRPVAGIYATPIAHAYVGIGNLGGGSHQPPNVPWSNTFVRLAPNAPPGPQNLGNLNVTDQVDALLTLLDNNAVQINGAPWVGYDAYVSVDRDFEKLSFTDYGDGGYSPADAWAAVGACLTRLRERGVRFRGFDICGLPTMRGTASTNRVWSEQEKTDQAIADITTLHNLVTALP
jgi:hypothetical protein